MSNNPIEYLLKILTGAVILALLIALCLILFSCSTTKNIQTSSVNTDSLVTHVKDSMSELHSKETTELKRMLEEMTSSGVTFTVDSCPERDAVLALLDSTGRANYEKIMLERKVKDLSNKVTISERGAITAEGRIQSAYFTNTKLQEELYRNEKTIDQLTKENDSLRAQKTITAETKVKEVKRRTGINWLLVSIVAVICTLLGWIAHAKISRRFKDTA